MAQNIINGIKSSYNYTVLLFISINSSTLNIIRSIDSISTEIISLIPNNSSKVELPPKEYFNSLLLNNKNNNKEEYQKNIKIILSNFKEESIDYLIFLINLFHNKSFIENNILIEQYNYLYNFLPFLYISLNTENNIASINKIQFRTKYIEDILIDQLNSLLSKFLVTDKIFSNIKKRSTEGIYIEKEIIYHLITKIITLNKIKIDQLYCFNHKFEQILTNPELIFIQEIESAPLYDFGMIKYMVMN